jgi:Tol biopolymer transport system component
MKARRVHWALATVAALLVVAVGAMASPLRREDATSEIVFASDRGNPNLGDEIYVLAAGRAPVNVSQSPAADAFGVIAADGKLVAFQSDRAGTLRVYLSRPDGSGLRMVPPLLPAGKDYDQPLAFSPDGSHLLVRTETARSASCKLFLVDVRSLRASPAGAECLVTWSPAGSRLVARRGARIVVYDMTGRRRFAFLGSSALWSARGDLAIVGASGATTLVVNEKGSPLARLKGAAAAWSADGSQLALSRPGALLLADLANPKRTRVLVRGAKSWSPNGVVFAPDGTLVRYTDASGATVAMPLAGGKPRALPALGSWARDGRYAFTRMLPPAQAGSLPRIEVEIGNRFGERARRAGLFAWDATSISTLTWSQDGSRLLYERSVDSPYNLWAVDADGTNLRRLTPLGGPSVSAPAWSADGTRLVYTSSAASACGFCDPSLVIATPDGQAQSTVPGVTPEQRGGFVTASLAPSATQLLVNECCKRQMYTVGVDGSGRLPLAPGPAGDSALSGVWSPDGTTIAYIGSDGIDLIAPDGSDRRNLLPPAATALAWSHDSKLLAYSQAGGIYLAPINSSAPPRLVVAADSPGGLSFSPDDSQLVYSASDQRPGTEPQHDLYIVSLAGGPAHVLAPSPYNDVDPAWQPLPTS